MLGMPFVVTAAFGTAATAGLVVLASLPPELPEAAGTGGAGVFDNEGQLILAILTLLVGAFNAWLYHRRESKKLELEEIRRKEDMLERKAARDALHTELRAVKTIASAPVVVEKPVEKKE